MINTKTRQYNYFTIGYDEEYGQQIMPAADAEPVGKIKIALFISSQAIQDNINFQDYNYIGLTKDAAVNDTYIIENEKRERLKVLYVNNEGKLKQVFLKKI